MTKKILQYLLQSKPVVKMREDINNPGAALNAALFFMTRGSAKRGLFYVGLLGAASYLSSGGNDRMFTESQSTSRNTSQMYIQRGDNIVDINNPSRSSRESRSFAQSNLESLRETTTYSSPHLLFF